MHHQSSINMKFFGFFVIKKKEQRGKKNCSSSDLRKAGQLLYMHQYIVSTRKQCDDIKPMLSQLLLWGDGENGR